MSKTRRIDGYQGQKRICLPHSVWENVIEPDPVLSRLYVAEIGYFPKATCHYQDRKKGSVDNILLYCVLGKGWYKIGDRRFEMVPNEFIILPAGSENISYGADTTDPWTIYWLHFSGYDLSIFNQRFDIGRIESPRRIQYNEKGLQLWKTMYEDLEKGYTNENLSNANLCLYHFIATFLFPPKETIDEKQASDDKMDEVIDFMHNKLEDILTIEEMAAICGLSTSHFSNVFRKATGLSPLLYFIRLKLEKACLHLHDSDMKVKDIASRLGYKDPYYFSRLFKKHMQISPESYREMRFSVPSLKPGLLAS